MPEWVSLSVFVVAGAAATLLWGRAMWYFDERSSVLRRLVFFTMGHTHKPLGEVRALLLSAVYYGSGLLLALLLAAAFGLSFPSIISFHIHDIVPVLLGIIGEISITSLLVQIGLAAMENQGGERFAELREIPWMKGLQQLPAGLVPFVAALGGAVEELFFRGVVLNILIRQLTLSPPLAIVIAGALFCVQQLLQVRTAFQAMVIASSCVAISLVGGLLVVSRGTIVPAVLCHASFVIFFMSQNARQQSRVRLQAAR